MSGIRIDLTGHVYGLLTVVSLTGKTRYGCSVWLCRCECGNEKEVNSNCLRTGNTKSCGCYRADALKKGRDKLHKDSLTHGMTKTKEHRTWRGLRSRCNDPSNKGYKNYGGRGIKVCERWDSFENFFADMGPAPSPKHSIDRFPNVNGDYGPGNCRWATDAEQHANRRDNCYLEYRGETKMAVEWMAISGLPKSTFFNRLYRGWPIEKVMEAPVDAAKRKKQ